ncbi:hypothetical protein R3P38DRAFT_3591876 [Favolaschia claudopus]|uniref:Ubiquitin-like protease family profile domain-containing protein n=1 Tax=Favolaschia claudopus TaxID=2862362 RepID=A0AAW0AIQ0_9AGAR
MAEYLSAVDDDDLQGNNSQWRPSEWIGCNKMFTNVPDFVAIEAVRMLQIPLEAKSSLPDSALSPAEFYASNVLPPWDSDIDSEEINTAIEFNATHPSFTPSSPCDIELFPMATLAHLSNTFGQAWFDGKISICDRRSRITRFYPLWTLSFMKQVRAAARSMHLWSQSFAWTMQEHENEEMGESKWRERTIELLSSLSGWTGQVGCGLSDLTFEHITQVLGENTLADAVLDALMKDIERRLKGRDGDPGVVAVADTFLPRCIAAGAARIPGHFGHALVQKYTRLLSTTSPSPGTLAFPVYYPPSHWAACVVDITGHHIQFGDGFRQSAPESLRKELVEWLKEMTQTTDLVITNDLPCGIQCDAVSCGVIAVNAIAHHVLGDVLWDPSTLRTHRYQAFCTIADLILAYNSTRNSTPPPARIDLGGGEKSAAQTDTSISAEDIDELVDSIVDDSSPAPLLPAKRSRTAEKAALPPPKRQKKEAVLEPSLPIPSSPIPSPLSPSSSRSSASKTVAAGKKIVVFESGKPKIPRHVQLEIVDTLREGGQSTSARHDRVVSVLIKHGYFRGDPSKLEKLKRECTRDDGDPNPGLDIKNPKQVVCSRCDTAVQLQSIYQPKRFRDHWDSGSCRKPPPANKLITGFFSKTSQPLTNTGSSRRRPIAKDLIKSCPGLTGVIHPRIDYYIEHSPATGAGAKEINHYVKELFESTRGISSIRDPRLTNEEWAKAYQCQSLDRRWQINTSAHHASVVSTGCLRKFTVHSQAELDDPTVKLKCTPKIFSNPIQSRLMAKYKGLEEILNEDGDLGIFARFARAVGQGRYKDNQVFLGLVETMQLATERCIRGVGMQNFKYPTAFREWGALIRMSSPRTYRNIAQEFRMESERSVKNRESKRPRFPIGITDANYEHLRNYLETYGYPPNYPLCISVDDTKLLPGTHPIYDGPAKKWMLVGLPGEKQLSVSSSEELERLMDIDHPLATKLRLWAIQIPFPGIPPLAFAILPISSTIKAAELVVHQVAAFDGLIEHHYRFISNVADGAAVERDCQARVAVSSV